MISESGKSGLGERAGVRGEAAPPPHPNPLRRSGVIRKAIPEVATQPQNKLHSERLSFHRVKLPPHARIRRSGNQLAAELLPPFPHVKTALDGEGSRSRFGRAACRKSLRSLCA